jgi:DNA-binding NarL/FixJ family response regulator
MATNKITLDSAWCKLIAQEDQYYRAIAQYLLLKEGIDQPRDAHVQEKIKYLSHKYLRISLWLGKPLTEREIECIYESACGKGTKEIATSKGISEGVIRKYRDSAFKKLRSEKIAEAVYFATQLGYLPLKDKQSLLQSPEIAELENAPV